MTVPTPFPPAGDEYVVRRVLARELRVRYGLSTIAFPWAAHGARYLRVSPAPYNDESHYRALAAALVYLGIRGAGEHVLAAHAPKVQGP